MLLPFNKLVVGDTEELNCLLSHIKSAPEHGDLALICKAQPSALTRAQYFLVLLPSERATEGLARSPF